MKGYFMTSDVLGAGAGARPTDGGVCAGLLRAPLSLLLALLVASGCSGKDDRIDGDGVPPPDPDAGMEDAGDDAREFPDTGIGDNTLLALNVVPNHGPFIGGNRVVVRGTGFTEDSVVLFGGRMVQPADTELIDSRRLAVVVPAGSVGDADVTVRVGDEEAVLPDGYTFDPFYVDPERGSVSGGTFVNVVSADVDEGGVGFEEGDTIVFGRMQCSDVMVVSPTRATCRTPPFTAGTVDVTIHRDDEDLGTIADGFTYYDSTDPFAGGLGGGPASGQVNITVINAMTDEVVSDAFTIVGEDLETPHQGLTDLRGQITFSGPDLIAPLTIHVAKHCFEKTSVVAFDASDVTIFLIPWMDPMCGMGGGGGGGGRGRNGAFISGELIWTGPNEYGPNPWFNVPMPRDDEERVAYVYTTQRAYDSPNPDPGLGGAIQRVREIVPDDDEALGYPYRIFARPSGLAVYALAGLENTRTGEFIPYVMGVARNVLAGPGEEVEEVDVMMNIPLDHTLEVSVEELPDRAMNGPDRFKVDAFIDLGGEGVIVREINLEELDVVRRRTADMPFRFWAQPALQGALDDGRYRISAGWFTGDFDSEPSTVVVRNGVRDSSERIVVNGFLGIPRATAPAYGEPLPEDRILRWTADGPTPDLHIVLMVGGDGNPAWRHFVPGNVHEAPIPDLSMIPEVDDISSGFITWVVYAVKIPGFRFDEFSYAYLNDRFWSHYSQDTFTAQR